MKNIGQALKNLTYILLGLVILGANRGYEIDTFNLQTMSLIISASLIAMVVISKIKRSV